VGELQNAEGPIDREIVSELIEMTPESWSEIVLEVEFCTQDGLEKYSHVVWSPGRESEAVSPSSNLFDATYRLGELFAEYGKRWSKVTYHVRMGEDGRWGYVADFDYPETASRS
jgi:hypothetical protein